MVQPRTETISGKRVTVGIFLEVFMRSIEPKGLGFSLSGRCGMSSVSRFAEGADFGRVARPVDAELLSERSHDPDDGRTRTGGADMVERSVSLLSDRVLLQGK